MIAPILTIIGIVISFTGLGLITANAFFGAPPIMLKIGAGLLVALASPLGLILTFYLLRDSVQEIRLARGRKKSGRKF